jgi:hypothetical protein
VKPSAFTIDIRKVDDADPEVVRRFYTLSVRARKGSPNVNDKYFGHYLIPISKTQESVYSVLISENFTAFFQMTVPPTRDGIKFKGIADILRELPAKCTHCVRVTCGRSGNEDIRAPEYYTYSAGYTRRRDQTTRKLSPVCISFVALDKV